MPETRDLTRRLRRSYLRYRRLAAAGFAAIAVVAVVHVVAPPAPATTPLAVASHDLLSGSTIGAGDVHLVHMAPDLVPVGATSRLSGLIGRVVAGPMRAGEPVTDQRVLGAALIDGYPDDVVAAPLRIQDGDVVSLLRVGDRIDIYSSNGDPTVPAPRVATDVSVVSLPVPDDSARDGALVVVAVTEADAARLAQASATTQLSISLRR